jgi:hypothetical protein
MSAIGPKRTSLVAPHMSAFGAKADMAICGMSAFAVAIGGKADKHYICLRLTQSGQSYGTFRSISGRKTTLS